MVALIILGIIAVLFAYLTQYEKTRFGLKVSFFLIFIFLALRYDFGHDYKGYLNIFLSAKDYSFAKLFDGTLYGEIGWLILNWLFKPFGFFALTAFLALINCVIYYRFIEKNVPVKYYWLAVFLYLFSPGLMLLHVTAMRQSLAIALFLFSFDYLYKKDAVRYFLIIGLASLFHSSALIMFPVFLLVFFKEKISYQGVIIIFLSIILLFFSTDFLKPILSQVITENLDRYETYTDLQGSGRTFIGVVYYFTILVLVLFFLRLWKQKTALIFKIYVISFFIYPLSLIIMFFTRLGMYFEPFLLIALPFLALGINRKAHVLKTIFILFVIIRTLYGFVTMITSDDGMQHYGIYHTIFSAPVWL